MQGMKFFNEGDKSNAVCSTCKLLRETTFAYRDVPFSDGSGIVKNILAGVCDHCGQVASIPAQSTPAIRKARSKSSESVEASLPAPYLDLLDLACFRIDPDFSIDLRKGLLMFYVDRFANGMFKLSRLKKASEALAKRPQMESTTKRRLSMKTSHRLIAALESVAEKSEMQKTQTIKAIIGAIQEDIVDGGKPELVANLKDYAIFVEA